jgi:hypothetical protein
MQYTEKGKCIFCLRESPEASFKKKPHTMPKSLGSNSIGFDICDECNHYFGGPDALSTPHLNIEECVKEVFGMTKHLLNVQKDDKYAQHKLSSRYFEYWHSHSKIKIKSSFKYNPNFVKTFTNQFKRGLYEMFLQEYHKATQNGLDSRFDEIRNYARYNKGSIPVYYMLNNGVYLLEKNTINPDFRFSENQYQHINDYGFYSLLLWGHWFFLEVTPRARLCRDTYLIREVRNLIGSGFVYRGCIELKSINDIDFTLRSLFSKKS